MDKEKNRLIGVAAIVVVIVAIVAAALVLTGDDDRGGDDEPEGVLFELTVSSNDGGSVSPAGTTKLAEGTTQTITITPDSGFIVSDVLLDGGSVGAVTSLKVEMDGNHTVKVVFIEETEPVPVEHTITASAGAGGRISPSGEVKVADGADQTFTFTANGSYRVSQVTVDGKTVTVTGNSYTFEDVKGDHTISVTFRYVGGGGGGTTPSVTLTGISVTTSPERTSYMEGEAFDPTGMVVTASYSNGSTKNITDYTCSPDGQLAVSNDEITVTYQGKTATVSITVIPESSTVTAIEVTKNPTKTHYFDDQELNLTGMVVSAVYNNEVKIPLSAGDYEYEESDGTVTVTYTADDSKTASFRVDRNNTITDLDELKHFRDNVNNGISYNEETVTLGDDIDLNGDEWEPIGKNSNPFKGIFDGQNHKISNLKIDRPEASDVGLFGYTTGGEIKRLVVENAVVTGYLDVGVVAGTPHTSKYSDITVTGHVEVSGYAYVGGVGGKDAYADWSNVKVEVDESSYVKAKSENYRTYVGGVIGFMGEGPHEMNGLNSNIDVFGSTCDVGGITGIAHYGNSFINCSSTGDVTLTNAVDEGDQLEIGGIAGVWMNSTSGDVTFKNCSYTGELYSSLNGVPVEDGYYPYGGLIGYKYDRTSNAGELIIEMEGITNAVYVGTVDELLKVGNGLSTNQSDYKDKTIVLMNNLNMTGKEWPAIVLTDKVSTLAFKGYGEGITISNLTIKEYSIDDSAKGSAGFISYTGSMNSLTFENITFFELSADVSSNVSGVGAFVGYAGTSDRISISDCNVLNSTVTGGKWTGGFVGYAAGFSTQDNGPVFEVLTIEDCMIEDSTVSSPGSAGGLIGHATGDAWTRDEFKNCTVKDCVITSTGESNEKAGSLMGTVGAGQTAYSKDGGVFVTYCVVENNTVKSNNISIDRIYGRQGTPGGVLCVDGTRIILGEEDLEDAIENRDPELTLASNMTFKVTSGIANEGEKARNVTIIGDGTQTVDVVTKAVSAEGGKLNYQRGSTFTFKNLTIQAGEGSFDGIVCDELTYIDCTIKGKLTLYGKATFINCTFDNTMANQYSIWTWGGTDVRFENCTFNTNGKAILLYGQATVSNPTNLVVKNCTFNDRNNGSAGKAVIEVGNDYNATYTLTIENATVNGFAPGKNTGSTLWANKNSMDATHLSVTIDGENVR